MSSAREADRPTSVSIVVVNWNGKAVLEECLASISRSEYPIQETVVVDNGSVDGSVEMLEAWCCPPITLLRNARNLGAPVARNQGIARALKSNPEFVFALDNDLTIAPDTIHQLVEVMRRDPRIAMAGALILRHDQPDVIFSAGHVINWTQNLVGTLGANRRLKGQFKGIWDVHYVGAGAVLIRTAYIREHGTFDEHYLGYGYEDTEYGFRASRLGYRVVCCAEAKVWHRPHSGIGRYSFRKKYLETRNAVRFIKKYGTIGNWSKYLFFLLAGFVYAFFREGLLRGNMPGVVGKMRGFMDGLWNRDELSHRLLNDQPRSKQMLENTRT